MVYYNQRDYAHLPYPSPTLPSATVASGGCGVCCASMLVENLLKGTSFPPAEAVLAAQSSGARVTGGTDMRVFAKDLCQRFPMKFQETTSLDAVLSSMRYGGAMAIANTKGNVGSYKGLFSDSGHYVVLAAVGESYVTVLDPYLYPGKFDKAWRKSKVRLLGNEAYVLPDDLEADCKRYFLFWPTRKEEKTMDVKDTSVKVGEKNVPAKLIDGVTYASLRPLVEALKEGLAVTWTKEEGAGVRL